MQFLQKYQKQLHKFLPFILSFCIILIGETTTILYYNHALKSETAQKTRTQYSLISTAKQLTALKHENQYVINQKQLAEIANIHKTYDKASSTYESIVDYKLSNTDTKDFDSQFAQVLKLLSQEQYASADAMLTSLHAAITAANTKAQAAATSQEIKTTNAPASNTPPGNGLSQQQVQTDNGTFLVDIIAGELGSTRVLVDTASDNDCSNNCPALPLADYATRSGAYAAINGSYFCPPEYPSCAGKTNSFDTLLMNKNKKYFNSSNNVYSTVPLVAFSGSSAIFKTQSLQWGRDTGVDAVIAMQPGLIFGGSIAYTDSSDPKYNSKGARDFIANKGSTVYIGTIHNATMGEGAKVLKALGMENAINLDEGGSTALWYSGRYINGPGRNIPNAVLFVRR